MRGDLASRGILARREATTARDGKWVETAGLVLVRQKLGSAKGVTFITIEDETGVATVRAVGGRRSAGILERSDREEWRRQGKIPVERRWPLAVRQSARFAHF
jgi:hypothetical protein